MKKYIVYLASFCWAVSLVSCEVADPFVDRIEAPLLVLVESTQGVASNGMTTEPTVTSAVSGPAVFSVRLLTLDKSGLLDYKVGIDSIPAVGQTVTVKLRSGASLGTFTTNASGRAQITLPWTSLGIAQPRAGSAAALQVSGSWEGTSYTKLFRISGI